MEIGLDVVEVTRIKALITRHKDSMNRIFTEGEIKYCERKKRKYEHFAARFAAKEAVFKALGTGWIGKLKWTDIELQHDLLGKPKVNLSGKTLELAREKGVLKVCVSLSHCREYAAAMVLLLSRNGNQEGFSP